MKSLLIRHPMTVWMVVTGLYVFVTLLWLDASQDAAVAGLSSGEVPQDATLPTGHRGQVLNRGTGVRS